MKKIINAFSIFSLIIASSGYSLAATESQSLVKSTYNKQVNTGDGGCLRTKWTGVDNSCKHLKPSESIFPDLDEKDTGRS